ncbi:MAG: hypothetical protein ACREM1_12905 [Longimicrobiales bacterium]
MKEPRKAAQDLARDLAGEFGDELRSVLLYGSITRDEYVDGVSNVNVLVLLNDISTRTFTRAGPLAHQWEKVGLMPMLLEREEWARASDVFAVEVLDMIGAHEVLHGDDPLDGLTVSKDALRLQAERELRVKLIGLHGAMLHASDSASTIGEILVAALPSFLTYARTALRLAGQDAPAASRDVIEGAAALIGFDPSGLAAALDARRRNGKWKVSLADAVVDRYHSAAEQMAAYVDRFGGST